MAHKDVESVFAAALEIPNRDRRMAFIFAECNSDAMRREVRSLLHAHEDAGAFLAQPHLAKSEETLAGFSTQNGLQDCADPGTRCGNYELIEEIARGGMGVVYRAKHAELNREVALKMILPSTLGSTDAVERFETETRSIAALDHPNIVPIFEVGLSNNCPYFTMPLVQGVTLAERITKSPLEAVEAAALCQQLAAAMACCHAEEIIHRDLKPSNILLARPGGEFPDSSGSAPAHTSYRVIVSDFGLAKTAADMHGPTLTGQIIGTPSFMAPEQALGTREITTAADIYSIGAVLYAMLTGRAPFRAAKPVETLRQVLNDEPVRPKGLESTIPTDLETICLKCLNKSPDKRYDSAQALHDDLGRFLNQQPIQARPVGTVERASKWIRRNPAWATAGVLSVLLIFAAIAIPIGVAFSEREHAKSLETEREETRVALAKTSQVTARSLVKEAQRLANEHSYRAALLSLADALEFSQAAKDTDLETLIRLNISVYSSQLNDLKRVINIGKVTDDLKFTPDGSVVAVGTTSGVELWDSETGEQLGTLNHNWRVHSFDFHPHEDMILTAVSDGSARLWNWKTGNQLSTFQHCNWSSPKRWPYKTGVSGVCFAGADLGTVVTAGFDGILKFWDLKTGNEIGAPIKHNSEIYAFSVSPNRSHVATGTQSHHVSIIDVDSRRIVAGPRTVHDLPESLDFHPDLKRILVGMRWSQRAAELDWNSGFTWRRNAFSLRHQEAVYDVSYYGNGEHAVTASSDFTTRFWSSRDGLERSSPLPHPDEVTDVAFSHDRNVLATACADGNIRLWQSPALIDRQNIYEDHRRIRSANFSPDGETITFGMTLMQGGLKSCPTKNLKASKSWPGPDPDQYPNPTKNGQNANWTTGVQYTSDGQFVFTADVQTQRIYKRKASNGQIVRSYGPHRHQIFRLALSPCEKFIAASGVTWQTNDTFNITVWHTRTGKQVGADITRRVPIVGFAFSEDASKIVAGFRDGLVSWFNVHDGQPNGDQRRFDTRLNYLDYDLSSQQIAIACADRTSRILSALDLQKNESIIRNGGAVGVTKLACQGTLLINGCHDRTTTLWHVATGMQIGTPTRFDLPCHCIAINRQQTQAFLAADDGSAVLLPFPSPSQQSAANLRNQISTSVN